VFERLVFKKIELWLVALLLIVIAIGVIAFAGIVQITSKDSERFGVLGEISVEIASLPVTMVKAGRYLIYGGAPDLEADHDLFQERSGFTYNYRPGSRPDAGYLALSRYDGDIQRSVVELVDLNAQEIVHRWSPDFAEINGRSQIVTRIDNARVREVPDRARMVHPYILDDGSLIYNDHSPLVRIDACSQPLWTIDRLFHHSIEPGADGGLWVPIHYEPSGLHGVRNTFEENGLAYVSTAGEVLFQVSLAQVLMDNGLSHFIYGNADYTDDPMHLNDIQEANFDSDYWNKGDLFLSLRNVSVVMLYRPSANKIVWYKAWPWVHQHDVNILDERRISIFDNQTYMYKYGAAVPVANDVKIFDFATGKIYSPWKSVLKQEKFRTPYEGRSKILSETDVFIEESNLGRAARVSASGEVQWEYINRAENGRLYRLSWSRMVDQDLGNRIVDAVRDAKCG